MPEGTIAPCAKRSLLPAVESPGPASGGSLFFVLPKKSKQKKRAFPWEGFARRVLSPRYLATQIRLA